MNERCPGCGGPVSYRGECPGWTRGGVMYVCQGCDNAAEWRCDAAPPCGWWYREPNNRSDKNKMGVRPEWFYDPMDAMDEDDQDDEPVTV